MKPKESAGCHQTLSAWVGSGDETRVTRERKQGDSHLARVRLLLTLLRCAVEYLPCCWTLPHPHHASREIVITSCINLLFTMITTDHYGNHWY